MENESNTKLKKELEEIKKLLIEQKIQNKKMMMFSFINSYILIAAVIFVAVFMERL